MVDGDASAGQGAGSRADGELGVWSRKLTCERGNREVPGETGSRVVVEERGQRDREHVGEVGCSGRQGIRDRLIPHRLHLAVAVAFGEVLEEHPAGVAVAVVLGVAALGADAVERPVRVRFGAAGVLVGAHGGPFGAAFLQPPVDVGNHRVLDEMEHLVRDHGIGQAFGGVEMDVVGAGNRDRLEQGVPAAIRHRCADRDRAVRHADLSQVVDRDVYVCVRVGHGRRKAQAHPGVEAASPFEHAEDIARRLLGDVIRAGRVEIVPRVVHREVVARKGRDPERRERIDRRRARHAHGEARRKLEKGKRSQGPRTPHEGAIGLLSPWL